MEDRGMPNSISFKQAPEDSPLKLLLAPVVDRRANAAASSRRGSAIFSPTQTLDQPPQLLCAHNKFPNSDPDPATTSNPNTSAPVRRPQAAPAETSSSSASSTKYRECLRNHAASIGNYVVDGCGEFMPSGEEGTFGSMRCAACNCHRSFHRRMDAVVDPHRSQTSYGRRNPPAIETHHDQYQPFPATSRTHPIMMSFGGNSTGGATAESSSEDLHMLQSSPGGHAVASSSRGSKKRFRTKLDQEQKDRMHEFADKLGWRIQRQDDEIVQQFCSEVGVKRQVFKVWMHNNKQAMKKRQI